MEKYTHAHAHICGQGANIRLERAAKMGVSVRNASVVAHIAALLMTREGRRARLEPARVHPQLQRTRSRCRSAANFEAGPLVFEVGPECKETMCDGGTIVSLQWNVT